jgi:hypothetical protein
VCVTRWWSELIVTALDFDYVPSVRLGKGFTSEAPMQSVRKMVVSNARP